MNLWNRFTGRFERYFWDKLNGLGIRTKVSRISTTTVMSYNVECQIGAYSYETGFHKCVAYCYWKAYRRFRKVKRFAEKYRCNMTIAIEAIPSKEDLHQYPREVCLGYPKVVSVRTIRQSKLYRGGRYTTHVRHLDRGTPLTLYDYESGSPYGNLQFRFASYTYLTAFGRTKTKYGWVYLYDIREIAS